MKDLTIKSHCIACGGTGLYSGMCEGKEEAVICLDCEGTGCYFIYYKPYTGRKKTNKFKKIKFRSTKLINETNSVSCWSYKEFLKNIKEIK